MFITFGTRFYGKVANVNGQWVETKFFSVMFLPIFPLMSFYVTGSEYNKRRGFDIAMHKTSVIAAYSRLIFFILSGWMLFLAYVSFTNYFGGSKSSAIIYVILGLAFAAAWVYFCFYYGKATLADMETRNKVGSVTGFYALPHWFDYPQLRNMLKSFQLDYKQKFPDSNWKADLMEDKVDPEKRELLFAIALFNCMVYDLPENDELYARADSVYALTGKTSSKI
jgi:uncharacterized membrane protein YuzA (DUF378 family)